MCFLYSIGVYPSSLGAKANTLNGSLEIRAVTDAADKEAPQRANSYGKSREPIAIVVRGGQKPFAYLVERSPGSTLRSMSCWADTVHPDVFGHGSRQKTRSLSFKVSIQGRAK